MTFSKSSQLALVSAIGLLIALLISACAEGSSDYIYVGSPAGINVYTEDTSTGVLSAQSLQTAGSINPVAMVASPDYANLYVLSSGTTPTITRFAINGDSSLALKESVSLPASSTPAALAVSPSGTYLFAAYQTSGGAATLAAYALTSGALSTSATPATYALALPSSSDTLMPTGLAVLPNSNAVYVTAYDQTMYDSETTSSTQTGWVFGFWIASSASSDKTPTDVSCSTLAIGSLCPFTSGPLEAGVKPSAILPDLTGRFAYIADYDTKHLIGYNIVSDSSSDATTYAIELSLMQQTSIFAVGAGPKALAIDPRGKYIYVANALDSYVGAYALNLSTGNLTGISSAATSSNRTDTTPVALTVDPAVGRYVLTANQNANDVSAFSLTVDTGAIAPTQTTHFSVSGAPTSIVAIPHGNHAVQVVAN